MTVSSTSWAIAGGSGLAVAILHFMLIALIALIAPLGVGCRRNTSPAGAMPIGPGPTTSAATTAPGPGRSILPRSMERSFERARMVTVQMERRGIRDQRVLAAMRNVPRHWFVPTAYQEAAYEDRAVAIGEGQTISQPYIVALMTEVLKLKSGEKVLEIGTGSGYQAAVLAELTDKVFTIEIVESLGRQAIQTLAERGYEHVNARIGDGYKGWPEEAPFDAIIVTCAPEAPPPALIEQLRIGGRMCIPVGPQGWGQNLVLMEKQANGSLRELSIAPVRFVPMTGEAEKSRTKGQ